MKIKGMLTQTTARVYGKLTHSTPVPLGKNEKPCAPRSSQRFCAARFNSTVCVQKCQSSQVCAGSSDHGKWENQLKRRQIAARGKDC